MPISVKELHLLNKISLIIDTAAELLEAKNDIVNRNLLSKRHVNNFFLLKKSKEKNFNAPI